VTTTVETPVATAVRGRRPVSRGLVTVLVALVLLFAAGFLVAPSSVSSGAIGSMLPFASVLAITWAVSTLLFGALSDRFGRRPVLLTGLALYAVAALAAGLSASFASLQSHHGPVLRPGSRSSLAATAPRSATISNTEST